MMIAYMMRRLISVLNEIAVAKLGAPPIVKRCFFKMICIPRLGTYQRKVNAIAGIHMGIIGSKT